MLKEIIKKLPGVRVVANKLNAQSKQVATLKKANTGLKKQLLQNSRRLAETEKKISHMEQMLQQIKKKAVITNKQAGKTEKIFAEIEKKNAALEKKLSLQEGKLSRLLVSARSSLSPEQREILLKWQYAKFRHKKLDLDNPCTYNEKMQWLKLYWNPEIKSRLTDKYLVREFVKEKAGEKYLIPLLGVWDSFEDIEFENLPERFVLKANHGCGMNLIVPEKSSLNYTEASTQMKDWLLTDFSLHALELHYHNIHPRVIAEEYIENFDGDVFDYKFWCFKGKVHYIQFLAERKVKLHMAFFDRDWNLMPFVYSYPRYTKEVPKPDNLSEMIDLAEKLAAGFEHVRVDLYRMNNGNIKFGEMTFTSAAGFCNWNPPEWDLKLGNLFNLPEVSLP